MGGLVGEGDGGEREEREGERGVGVRDILTIGLHTRLQSRVRGENFIDGVSYHQLHHSKCP